MTTLAPWLDHALQRLMAQRGHAWLVTGTSGLGQFDLSMALAASWLCERPEQVDAPDGAAGKPLQAIACGTCDACHMVRAKSHPDLAVLLPETLSLALGCTPKFDDLDPKAEEAVAHILARAKAHGVVAGVHNGAPEAALKRIAEGFQFVTIGSDARLMAAGAQAVMAKMRAAAAPTQTGGY